MKKTLRPPHKPTVLTASALATVRGGGGKPIIRNDDGTDGDSTIRNKGTT